MLFLLYQTRFILNTEDPWIKASLMKNLKARTKQRRYDLKAKFWDNVVDKKNISRTPPEDLQNMNAVEWSALLDSWGSSKKQVLVFVHSSLLLFQFYNLDCC